MNQEIDSAAIYLTGFLNEISKDRHADILRGKFAQDGLGLGDGDFSAEYRACCRAVAAHAWEWVVCENRRWVTGDEKKLFKLIMKEFDSPETLSSATAFSDYYCQARMNSEAPLAVALALRFCERTAKPQVDRESLSVRQVLMAETLEGLRVAFENRFDEFVMTLIKK